jgi:hypothetical protein
MARMEAPANDKLDTDPFQIRVARHEVSTGRRGHGERRLCSVQRQADPVASRNGQLRAGKQGV